MQLLDNVNKQTDGTGTWRRKKLNAPFGELALEEAPDLSQEIQRNE